jgi:hypothetical protein
MAYAGRAPLPLTFSSKLEDITTSAQIKSTFGRADNRDQNKELDDWFCDATNLRDGGLQEFLNDINKFLDITNNHINYLNCYRIKVKPPTLPIDLVLQAICGNIEKGKETRLRIPEISVAIIDKIDKNSTYIEINHHGTHQKPNLKHCLDEQIRQLRMHITRLEAEKASSALAFTSMMRTETTDRHITTPALKA